MRRHTRRRKRKRRSVAQTPDAASSPCSPGTHTHPHAHTQVCRPSQAPNAGRSNAPPRCVPGPIALLDTEERDGGNKKMCTSESYRGVGVQRRWSRVEGAGAEGGGGSGGGGASPGRGCSLERRENEGGDPRSLEAQNATSAAATKEVTERRREKKKREDEPTAR